jgi:hypothetical protein
MSKRDDKKFEKAPEAFLMARVIVLTHITRPNRMRMTEKVSLSLMKQRR